MLTSICVKLQLRSFQHSLELAARLVRMGFVIAASWPLMGNGRAWVKAKKERAKRPVINLMFVESVAMLFLTLW